MSLRNNYCRLCFEIKTNYLPFDDKTAKMLKSLTKIEIVSNENISACANCLEELEIAYNIQQKILNAETRHEGELLADFLIENHDELKKQLLIPYTFNKLQLGDMFDSEIINNNNLAVEDSNSNAASVKFPTDLEHSVEIDEGDILCERCGDVFSDAVVYDKHMKTVHMGPHVCDGCGADFFEISDLQQHFKSKHSRLKPFVCEVCHEAFALRYILQLHKLQHTHDSPYVCEFCTSKFKYSCSLNIHLKIKHDSVEERPQTTKA